MIYILSFLAIILSVTADHQVSDAQEKGNDILKYVSYNQCEGKDAINITITIIELIKQDSLCRDKKEGGLDQADSLISITGPTGQRSVTNLRRLAISSFPAGAYVQAEKLWLATCGSFEGKYLYEKTIYLSSAYLKKCSSILGYSYTSSKSTTLLIADKLDLSTFLTPTGAAEQFRKTATTICQGVAYCF